MHEFEDAVAAALHREMGALAQLGQPPEGFHQVVTVAFGVGRGKPDAFQAFDLMYRFDQLHETRICRSGPLDRDKIPPAVAGDDLPEQGDFLHAGGRQLRGIRP